MKIEENELENYKSNIIINEKGEQYQKIISILKEKYKFNEEQISEKKILITEIIHLLNYILKNSNKMVNYKCSYVDALIKALKNQINNAKQTYENTLKMICVNFYYENLTPLTILRSSINKNSSVNINTNKEIEEREKILLINEIYLKYINKIDLFFKEYQNKIDKEYEDLLLFDGKKDLFKRKIQESDYGIQKYIEEMNIHINKEMKELNKEIDKVLKKVLDESECNLDQQKYTVIKDMVNNYFGVGVTKSAILGGGVSVGFGGDSVSSELIALQTGFSVGLIFPIVGTFVGAGLLLTGGIVLLHKWLRNETKYDKIAIDYFKKKHEDTIKKSEENIKEYIKENINKAIKKLKFFYYIDKENLDEFKKNRELFEKYYKEYENLLNESFGLI